MKEYLYLPQTPSTLSWGLSNNAHQYDSIERRLKNIDKKIQNLCSDPIVSFTNGKIITPATFKTSTPTMRGSFLSGCVTSKEEAEKDMESHIILDTYELIEEFRGRENARITRYVLQNKIPYKEITMPKDLSLREIMQEEYAQRGGKDSIVHEAFLYFFGYYGLLNKEHLKIGMAVHRDYSGDYFNILTVKGKRFWDNSQAGSQHI